MTETRTRAALLALTLLSGCSGGSGAPEASASAATILSCEPGAIVATPGGSLLNNQWNAASAGPGAWQQCLRSRPRQDGGTEYGWSWTWPTQEGLYAYPEILVGGSPWSSVPSNDPRFPRTVAETQQLSISYDIESSFDGKNNLAVEFWFVDPLAAALANGRQPVKTELMIWSDESDGMIPASDAPVGTVDIDGASWTVYLHRDWGDASGVTGTRWTYIAYHATHRSHSASYDARKFFDDAMARGVIATTDRIEGVELGNELVSGSGASWIRNYTLSIQ